mmetsp:Transcript_39051/g.47584  ORF Transcript_39051/g.47584 Transcript_39051/m.47584 type:complete len:363 (+) Transcript_39051:530-1618(+)
MLVKEFRSPGDSLFVIIPIPMNVKLRKIATLHPLRHLNPSSGQYGRSHINIQRQIVVDSPPHRVRHSWIFDNQGNANTLLVWVPLLRQAVLPRIQSVIRSENNKSVVEYTLLFQFFQDATTGGIYLGGHAVHVLHHNLMFLWRVVAFEIADPSFVIFGDKGREPISRLVGVRSGLRHRHVFVQSHAFPLRKVLFGIHILGMRGEERRNETKGLIPGPPPQKINGILLVLFRHVNMSPPTDLKIMLPVIHTRKIELVFRKLVQMPFPHQPDVVPPGPEQAGKRFVPILQKRAIFGIHRPVTAHVLTRDERHATDPTHRRRYAIVTEPHAFLAETIEHGCFYHRVTRGTESVVPPVVRVQEENV